MNRYLGLATILLAAVYLIAAAQLPTAVLGDPLGPAVFPYIIGGSLLLTGAVLVIRPGPAAEDAAPQEEGAAVPSARTVAGIAGILAWSAIYFFAFERIGFPLATFLYLLVLLVFMHPRRHLANGATALAFVAVSYWMFAALGVRLPASF